MAAEQVVKGQYSCRTLAKRCGQAENHEFRSSYEKTDITVFLHGFTCLSRLFFM
jgi:hypothetical protein